MSAEKFYQKGKKHFDDSNYESSLKQFSLSLQEENTHLMSLYGRALSYFKLQQFDNAIKDFDKLINLSPGNATYHSDRGVALHLAGNNTLALEDFDKGVELEPENPYRYSSRAYIKERMKNYEGSVADYTRAIELDPEDAVAYNNRGLVEEKLGYQQKAQQSFSKADELMPAKPRPKATEQYTYKETAKIDAQEVGFKQYLSVIGSVFTSRKQWKEFIGFVGNKFSASSRK